MQRLDSEAQRLQPLASSGGGCRGGCSRQELSVRHCREGAAAGSLHGCNKVLEAELGSVRQQLVAVRNFISAGSAAPVDAAVVAWVQI